MENLLRETPEVRLEESSQSAASRSHHEADELQREGRMCGSRHAHTPLQSHPPSERRAPIKIEHLIVTGLESSKSHNSCKRIISGD